MNVKYKIANEEEKAALLTRLEPTEPHRDTGEGVRIHTGKIFDVSTIVIELSNGTAIVVNQQSKTP